METGGKCFPLPVFYNSQVLFSITMPVGRLSYASSRQEKGPSLHPCSNERGKLRSSDEVSRPGSLTHQRTEAQPRDWRPRPFRPQPTEALCLAAVLTLSIMSVLHQERTVSIKRLKTQFKDTEQRQGRVKSGRKSWN